MDVELKNHDQSEEISGGQVYSDGYVVGICFAQNSKSYFFHTTDPNIQKGVNVVVETVRGIELGTVVKESQDIKTMQIEFPLKPIVRVATPRDIQTYKDNLVLAEKALVVCQEAVSRLNLDMRLLKADYTLDNSKVIIVYVADNRVDFRDLLKELAFKLKCRIELRQIGTRDRSKLIGGIGICGLPLCCSNFLGEFDGISINMAKNQFLALNIQKLSGHCGKLICCLKYEDAQYSELRKGLPKVGVKLKYEDAIYKITSINILTSQVRLENSDDIKVIALSEVQKILKEMNPDGKQG